VNKLANDPPLCLGDPDAVDKMDIEDTREKTGEETVQKDNVDGDGAEGEVEEPAVAWLFTLDEGVDGNVCFGEMNL
jgi:hypothetical protein